MPYIKGVDNSQSQWMRRLRILLIDDTRVVLDLTAQDLKLQGFDITSAYGPQQGLKAMQVEEFDIVLCDFQMVGMNGYQLTKKFREWEKAHRPQGEVQTIFGLTAYASTEVTEQCISAGMQGVLTKPLQIDIMNELLLLLS